jgi:Glycosyl hydrolases family 18
MRSISLTRLRVLVAAALVLTPVLLLAAGAGSGSGTSAAAGRPGALPVRVFAPYFETWSTNRLIRVAERSGVRNFTLAFIQAPKQGSCTPTWNGEAGQTMAAGRYLPGLRALRRLGGHVVPSFGGYSADHALTEIADSCMNMHKLVTAYESVVRTYGATRLDMDVEDRSLENHVGIDRRNKALRRVEAWAARTGRPLQISYTLPVEPAGLESDGLHVLRNAVRNGTRVDVVNIMTFDYYDGVTTDMGAAAVSAARGLHRQLHALYPHRSSRRLWAMEGNTILPGIDDYPRKTEVTTLADAAGLLRFARSVGISTISMWAIERDNGACPGRIDSNTCSGVVQPDWAFSHLLEPFTGG